MPERTHYAPGTPSWVDLASPDVEASKRFYSALLGWDAETSDDPNAGGYTMFSLGGKSVAGLGPALPDRPPAWSSYVTVEDADATVAAARAAGGSVFLEPMDVLDAGRMAVIADPTGAALSLWQPRAHIGAGLVNEPGTLCWNELQARDLATSQAFFEKLFGWKGEPLEGPVEYVNWMLGGESIGGMLKIGDDMPAELPPHWAVYFAVASCAETVAKAEELGATIAVPPTEIQPGTFSVIIDPQGASFHVLEFREA